MLKFILVFGFAALTASSGFAAKPEIPAVCRNQISSHLPNHKFAGFWWPDKSSSKPDAEAYQSTDFKNSKRYQYHGSAKELTLSVADFKAHQNFVYRWQVGLKCSESIAKSALPERRKIASTNDFDDEDLMKLIQANPWGVIYVWSPYMPLSLMAIDEIRKAMVTRPVGKLTILLDPRARPEDVKLVVEKFKLTNAELVMLESDELRARGFGLHYPAAIIYHDGFLGEHAFLGHKTSEAYSRWIDLELHKLPKGK